eukprot:4438718-Pyramimonas_sp.AAC.1
MPRATSFGAEERQCAARLDSPRWSRGPCSTPRPITRYPRGGEGHSPIDSPRWRRGPCQALHPCCHRCVGGLPQPPPRSCRTASTQPQTPHGLGGRRCRPSRSTYFGRQGLHTVRQQVGVEAPLHPRPLTGLSGVEAPRVDDRDRLQCSAASGCAPSSASFNMSLRLLAAPPAGLIRNASAAIGCAPCPVRQDCNNLCVSGDWAQPQRPGLWWRPLLLLPPFIR